MTEDMQVLEVKGENVLVAEWRSFLSLWRMILMEEGKYCYYLITEKRR